MYVCIEPFLSSCTRPFVVGFPREIHPEEQATAENVLYCIITAVPKTGCWLYNGPPSVRGKTSQPAKQKRKREKKKKYPDENHFLITRIIIAEKYFIFYYYFLFKPKRYKI